MSKRSKKVSIMMTMLLGLTNFGFSSPQAAWNRVDGGMLEADTNFVYIHPINSLIYVGTSKALYKSPQNSPQFKAVLNLQSNDKNINFIYSPLDRPNNLYAATDDGLYASHNEGHNWTKQFSSSDPQSRQCLSILADGDKLYLGTLKGLFLKENENSTWQKATSILGNESIFFLKQDGQFLYIATKNRFYRLNKTTQLLQQLFAVNSSGNLTVENGSEASDHLRLKDIKFVNVLRSTHTEIYLATKKGIFYSWNGGEQWRRIPSEAVPLDEITSALVIKTAEEDGKGKILFLGTAKGVFRYSQQKWIPVYRGLETNVINYLAHAGQGKIYSATDRGIFLLSQMKTFSHPIKNEFLNMNYKTIKDHFLNEPSINEVQELAVEYAEVHPNKISKWRRDAKYKALLPSLSAGIDRVGSDIYHWNTGASPDELQKGKEYLEWDVSVSWDLADFIWSTDQTTIDSRSKLMVELREDILDEITRLYFERRRIQVELLTSAVPVEPQFLVEREMRIEELTALIDSLTGGEFSRRIKEKKSQSHNVRKSQEIF